MIEVTELSEQEAQVFNNLTQAQQDALLKYEDTAYQYFDFCRNDQIPEGTPYEHIEVYVNNKAVVHFTHGEVAGDVEEVDDDVHEISIWANGEVVWLQADGVMLLDHTRLNPLEINPFNLSGGAA